MKQIEWENEFAIMSSEIGRRWDVTWTEYTLHLKDGIKAFEQKMWINKSQYEDHGFCDCGGMDTMQIHIPGSVTSIGHGAFSEISSIRKLFIPESVEVIDHYAFYKCKSLEELTVYATCIGHSSFTSCRQLKKVTIGQTVSEIDSMAFEGCRSLQEIEIKTGLKKIENLAFCDCKKLERIEIPYTVECIGENVFMNCYSLKEIKVPEHLLSMYGKEYFMPYPGFTGVNIIAVSTPKGYKVAEKVANNKECSKCSSTKDVGSGSAESSMEASIPMRKSYNGIPRKNLIIRKK